MLFLCLLWVSLVLGGAAGYLGCRPALRGRGLSGTWVRVGGPVWLLRQGDSPGPIVSALWRSPLRFFPMSCFRLGLSYQQGNRG